jgi:Tfp pilus assembly protein PilE
MSPISRKGWFERPAYDGFFEILLVLLVLAILFAVAFPYYKQALTKAISNEAMVLSTTARLDVHEHYAMTDTWLSKASTESDPTNTEDSTQEIAQGAVTVILPQSKHPRLQGKKLTFRPVAQPNDQGTSIAWLCGYSQLSDRQVNGIDRTDIPAENLPRLCREEYVR